MAPNFISFSSTNSSWSGFVEIQPALEVTLEQLAPQYPKLLENYTKTSVYHTTPYSCNDLEMYAHNVEMNYLYGGNFLAKKPTVVLAAESSSGNAVNMDRAITSVGLVEAQRHHLNYPEAEDCHFWQLVSSDSTAEKRIYGYLYRGYSRGSSLQDAFTYDSEARLLLKDATYEVVWIGGRTAPPPDRPKCGLHGELCLKRGITAETVAGAVFGNALATVILFTVFRWVKRAIVPADWWLLDEGLLAMRNPRNHRRSILLQSVKFVAAMLHLDPVDV
ncbi:hypothetical protein BV898_06520 [Hypsibius exemplaris]|uniref:Uncharacterized protein n=1 Tax=Hypsibius exemplaris TaxID=2072580 RepID=A0A1W0WWH5_HYPEX|nr:hypothetical protein BV898_06520 [Hypsibius exemplaris]